jgi:IS5 family transposase
MGKLHIRANTHGLPIALHLTTGQEADCSNYDRLMEARDSNPAIMPGDQGYHSDPIRQHLRDRGGLSHVKRRATDPVAREHGDRPQ